MSELYDKFTKLANSVSRASARARIMAAQAVGLHDPTAHALASWAADDSCRDTFMPWLVQQIKDAQSLSQANYASHPDVCYALGWEAALRSIHSAFLKWQGQVN